MTNTASLPFRKIALTIGASAAAIGYFFSNATGSIGMMLFILSWLINYRDWNFGSLYKNQNLWLIWGFYLLIILASFYSINTKQANKEVVRFLSFAIYPLIFVTIKDWKLIYIWVKRMFIIALLVLFSVTIIYAIYRQIVFSSGGGPFNWYFFYRYDLLEIFKQHPTYVSIFTLLGLSFINFSTDSQAIFRYRWINYLISITLITAIVLYGSRIAYIILGLFILIYIVKLILNKNFKTIGLIGILTILMMIIGWNIPIVKERVLFTFGEKYQYQFNNAEAIKDGSPENQGRLLLWQNAFDLIQQKIIFGYGTGSSKQILAEKYAIEGHEVFLQEKYNAHNTYIEMMIWGGIILGLAYIVLLLNILYNAIKSRNLELFSFFLIVAVSGITETLFIAQGVMFIAFFYSFYLIKNKVNG